MQVISYFKIFIRILLFSIASLRLFALLWFYPYYSNIYNFFILLFIFILFVLSLISSKKINQPLYLSSIVIGLMISIYDIYHAIIIRKTLPDIELVATISLFLLLILNLKNRDVR